MSAVAEFYVQARLQIQSRDASMASGNLKSSKGPSGLSVCSTHTVLEVPCMMRTMMRALMFAQEPALQSELVFVHMLHGLHGHLTSMLGHC